MYIFTVLEDSSARRPLCLMSCAQNQAKELHGHADLESIDRAGARITGAVSMEHGSLLILPGSLNRAHYHCVLKERQQKPHMARRVSYTVRFCMRLYVNTLVAEYRLWTKSRGWQTRAIT